MSQEINIAEDKSIATEYVADAANQLSEKSVNTSEKKYQKKLKKPYDFSIGEYDNDGSKIERIYSVFLHYVIYRTKSSIRLEIDDESPLVKEVSDRHYLIGVELARLYSWLPLDLSESESLNKLIGRAMTMNAAGHTSDAKKVLALAEERLINLKLIEGRLEYTIAAFLFMVFCIISSLISLIYFKNQLPLVIIFGSLGGFLSIAIGYKKLQIDIDAKLASNCLVGISRIVISIIAAIFSYLAVSSKIAFPFLAETESSHGILLLAMIAGFVEMFVPNLMNNLAGSKDSGEHAIDNLGEPTKPNGSL